MDDDKPSSGGGRRRPPPPVIDLTPTDVSGPRPTDSAHASNPGGSGDPPREPPSGPDERPPFWRTLRARLRFAPWSLSRLRAWTQFRTRAWTGTWTRSWVPSLPSWSSSWPLPATVALCGALALVIVLGIYALIAPPGREESELAGRVARLETQLRAAPRTPPADTASADALNQRVARLEAALAGAQPGDPALANRLGALEAETKVLANGAANLDRRVDAAAKSLTDVAAQLAQLNAERARTPPVERRDLDDASRRLAALESSIKSLGEQLGRSVDPAGERALRTAVLGLALNRAVERGGAYARELAALDPQLAGPARAALAPFADTGIPPASALARELVALMPAARAAADVTPREGGFLDRLGANAERLVRVRPLGQPQGDDPAAVLARLEAAAAHDDIAGALAEAAKLPDAARAPLESWIKRARGREAALAAAARLADVSDLAGQGAPTR